MNNTNNGASAPLNQDRKLAKTGNSHAIFALFQQLTSLNYGVIEVLTNAF